MTKPLTSLGHNVERFTDIPTGLKSESMGEQAAIAPARIEYRWIGYAVPEARTRFLGAAAAPWYIAVAEDYIARNIQQPITMPDLASASGVSKRTLQQGFRKHRGVSPMRFLRDQRLAAARSDLLNPGGNTSVTGAADRWGFKHLSRFSAYYSKQFGERPSETLRAAKAADRKCMTATFEENVTNARHLLPANDTVRPSSF